MLIVCERGRTWAYREVLSLTEFSQHHLFISRHNLLLVEPSACLPGPSEICFPSTYPTSFSISIWHLPSGPGIWFYSRPPEYATLGQLALTRFCGRPAICRVLTRCSSPGSLLVHKTLFPSRAHCTFLNHTASCFQTHVPFVPRSAELGHTGTAPCGVRALVK